ncbi:MAG: hypothetical protein GOU97_04205 [Nanoarchaeota archaeon]|nr:hypothetical protein [Nanoarchaeota archaeon]
MNVPHLDKGFDIDAYISDIVKLHGDKKNGSPYWIKWQEKTGIDITSIDCIDDLSILSLHEPDVFKVESGLTSLDLIPKSLRNQRGTLFPTVSSGTTSAKKTALRSNEYRIGSAQWWSYNLDHYKIPRDLDCFGVGTAQFWGKNVEDSINARNGIFYPIYVETRGVKNVLVEVTKLKSESRLEEADGRLEEAQDLLEKAQGLMIKTFGPMIEETARIITPIQPGIMSNPATLYLEVLPKVPGGWREKLQCAIVGGDSFGPEAFRAITEMYPKAKVIPYFGHFLSGAAFHRPNKSIKKVTGLKSKPFDCNYYPSYPWNITTVIDDKENVVDFGEEGRLVLTTLDKALLWRGLEDVVDRLPPCSDLPWEGFRNARRPSV